MTTPGWATSPSVRKVMQATRGRDSGPELALRRAVHALGLRYLVDAPPLAGSRRRADLVFRRERVAVFMDGCFWHGCPEHYRASIRNSSFWVQKVDANKARDAATDEALVAAGWLSVRIWEHEDPKVAAPRIQSLILERRGTSR